MVDVVGLWFRIAETWVWSQTYPFVMCCGQSGIDTGFSPRVLRHSRVSIISPMLHNHPQTLCKYGKGHPFCGRWHYVMLAFDSVFKLKARNLWNIRQKCWRHDRNFDKDRMTLDSLPVADYAPNDSCCERGKVCGDAEWRSVDWSVVTKVSKACTGSVFKVPVNYLSMRLYCPLELWNLYTHLDGVNPEARREHEVWHIS